METASPSPIVYIIGRSNTRCPAKRDTTCLACCRSGRNPVDGDPSPKPTTETRSGGDNVSMNAVAARWICVHAAEPDVRIVDRQHDQAARRLVLVGGESLGQRIGGRTLRVLDERNPLRAHHAPRLTINSCLEVGRTQIDDRAAGGVDDANIDRGHLDARPKQRGRLLRDDRDGVECQNENRETAITRRDLLGELDVAVIMARHRCSSTCQPGTPVGHGHPSGHQPTP